MNHRNHQNTFANFGNFPQCETETRQSFGKALGSTWAKFQQLEKHFGR